MSIAEKLTTIAENEQKVYDAGAKSEYDKFWDSFQNNGTKTNYNYAFYQMKEDICKPKYDIQPSQSQYIFMGVSWLIDLDEWQKNCGITLDFSKSTNMYCAFQTCPNLTTIGTLDLSSCTQCYRIFQMSQKLTTIKRLILSETTSTFTQTFHYAGLVTVNFEGVLANNGLDLSTNNKLSHDSLLSLLNILKDYSGSGTSHSVTLGTTNLAKLTDAEKAIATEKGWTLA